MLFSGYVFPLPWIIKFINLSSGLYEYPLVICYHNPPPFPLPIKIKQEKDRDRNLEQARSWRMEDLIEQETEKSVLKPAEKGMLPIQLQKNKICMRKGCQPVQPPHGRSTTKSIRTPSSSWRARVKKSRKSNQPAIAGRMLAHFSIFTLFIFFTISDMTIIWRAN